MRYLLAVLAFLGSLGAPAAEPRRYAVMSLLGDGITIVTARMSTGSNMDPNHRLFVPLADRVLDAEVLGSIRREIQEVDKDAKVVLLGAKDPKLFEIQRGSLDGPVAALLPEVTKSLDPGEATHLVLVTKYRQEARLQYRNTKEGIGFVEGLGFYIDRSIMVGSAQDSNKTRGVMAPYAYFRVALVDLAAGKVLRDEPVTETGDIYIAAKVASGDVWDALSGKEKIEVLRNLIADGLNRAVPVLLQ